MARGNTGNLSERVSEEDWLFACGVALLTQDPVQRQLLEIIARARGKTLPAFPGPYGSAA